MPKSKVRESKPRHRSVVKLSARPITTADFPALSRLFGSNGACGGCWCMYWRVPSMGQYWAKHKGAKNKQAFRALVESGAARGVLAFAGEDPIGWCSYGPREDFAYLARSRVLPKPETENTWAVTCFFVQNAYRHQGVSGLLLRTACSDARKRGAEFIEGYPASPRPGLAPAAFVHTGLLAPFAALGFETVATAGARLVVRKRL